MYVLAVIRKIASIQSNAILFLHGESWSAGLVIMERVIVVARLFRWILLLVLGVAFSTWLSRFDVVLCTYYWLGVYGLLVWGWRKINLNLLNEPWVRACRAIFDEFQFHAHIMDIRMTCLFGFAVCFTASLHDGGSSVWSDMHVYTTLYVLLE